VMGLIPLRFVVAARSGVGPIAPRSTPTGGSPTQVVSHAGQPSLHELGEHDVDHHVESPHAAARRPEPEATLWWEFDRPQESECLAQGVPRMEHGGSEGTRNRLWYGLYTPSSRSSHPETNHA
jgi:hypothetical protein